MNWKIPLFKSTVTPDDVEAVTKVLSRATSLACGPEIEVFEKKVRDYLGAGYVLAFNSGTSALHTLLLAHDIKGKEVIVPSFTFIATANAVLLAGGIPVFAEVEEETFGLDYEDVKNRINSKTAAIIIVHYGGCIAKDALRIKKLAEEKGLLFIEDSAQSIGATTNDLMAGTLGDSAIFSLCQNKLLSVGEGGLLITKHQDVFEKAKLLRSHGRVETGVDYFDNTGDNDYIVPGYNFRMPSMNAAMGITQLRNIGLTENKRRNIASAYQAGLGKLKRLVTPKPPRCFKHQYQMYTLRFKDKALRDRVQKHLTDKGIMSKVYFQPIHLKTLYGLKKGSLPKTEALSDKVLTIPIYPGMSKKQTDYIINSIKEVIIE
jgi:perosamine synthetase